jgi:fluoride ion exporter CrcB/FEX
MTASVYVLATTLGGLMAAWLGLICARLIVG